MLLNKATAGLAVCAVGAGTALGHGLVPLLRQGAASGSPVGGSFALVRYEGWLQNLLAVQVFCCAIVTGIVRLGSRTSIGPNAQLAIFHDGNSLVGVALAIGLHGGGAAWPLGFLVAGRLLVSAAQALRLRVGVASGLVWAYAAVALLLNNASEGADAAFWCERTFGAGSAWLPLAVALDGFRGVAPVHFTVGVTFRYTIMRFISWALDTLSGRVVEATRTDAVQRAFSVGTESPRIAAVGGASSATVESNAAAAAFHNLVTFNGPDSPQKVHAASTAGLMSTTWPAFFSYTLHVPTYVAGPLVPAANYFQQAAAVSAGYTATTRRSLEGATWWRTVARMAGFALFAELLRRTFFADNTVQALLAEQPWQAWAVGYCVLTALFAQSYVPWTFARLCSSSLGIFTDDEAPLGFLRSSTSPRTFWRNFHVSWHRWLLTYVHIPLGGSAAACAATVVVSALLHGTHRAWLTFGAIQASALLAERWLDKRSGGPLLSRLHPYVRTALAQCLTQTTLLAQLPLGPSLPRFLVCFHAINLPFCMLNAARLAAARKNGPSGSAIHLRKRAKLAWE